MIKRLKIKSEAEIENMVNPYIEQGYKIINIFPYPDGDKQVIIAILERENKDKVING